MHFDVRRPFHPQPPAFDIQLAEPFAALTGTLQRSPSAVAGVCLALQLLNPAALRFLHARSPMPLDALPSWRAREALIHEVVKTAAGLTGDALTGFLRAWRYSDPVSLHAVRQEAGPGLRAAIDAIPDIETL